MKRQEMIDFRKKINTLKRELATFQGDLEAFGGIITLDEYKKTVFALVTVEAGLNLAIIGLENAAKDLKFVEDAFVTSGCQKGPDQLLLFNDRKKPKT